MSEPSWAKEESKAAESARNLEHTFGWSPNVQVQEEANDSLILNQNDELIVPKNLLTELNKETGESQYELNDNRISIFNNQSWDYDSFNKTTSYDKCDGHTDSQPIFKTKRDRGVGPDIPAYPESKEK